MVAQCGQSLGLRLFGKDVRTQGLVGCDERGRLRCQRTFELGFFLCMMARSMLRG